METSTDTHDVDHLRDRVRLYLQVMLIIDIGSHLSVVVTPLFLADLKPPARRDSRLVRRSVSARHREGFWMA